MAEPGALSRIVGEFADSNVDLDRLRRVAVQEVGVGDLARPWRQRQLDRVQHGRLTDITAPDQAHESGCGLPRELPDAAEGSGS